MLEQISTPLLFVGILVLYFLVLVWIGRRTSAQGDNTTFFTGNRSSPWYLVAYGMIGASLSGVTFLSIPGDVLFSGFSYMQLVAGYIAGYLVIAFVLLPVYYKLNLTTIYGYLEQRFGRNAYKTGAFYFLLSRSIGSAFRLFLVALVLQTFISDPLGFPFEATVLVTIILIWVYSFKGGIKTIVYTDTLQTTFMLLSLGISLVYLWQQIQLLEPNSSVWQQVGEMGMDYWLVWEPSAKNHFLKHFFGGMFITITMTGLDQDMMQKNLTCKSLKESQKNVLWMSSLLVPVNFLFLLLGSLLYVYGSKVGFLQIETLAEGKKIWMQNTGIISSDKVFAVIAAYKLPVFAALLFFVGLVAAAYSTADSGLTALTTTFCVDFLGFKEGKGTVKQRYWVHFAFSMLLFVMIIVFKKLNNEAVIKELFTIAGYTYGPLLGMFTFGLLHKHKTRDMWIPIVCVLSPLFTFVLHHYSEILFNGYVFGFELLLVNGFITYLGLWVLSWRRNKSQF